MTVPAAVDLEKQAGPEDQACFVEETDLGPGKRGRWVAERWRTVVAQDPGETAPGRTVPAREEVVQEEIALEDQVEAVLEETVLEEVVQEQTVPEQEEIDQEEIGPWVTVREDIELGPAQEEIGREQTGQVQADQLPAD